MIELLRIDGRKSGFGAPVESGCEFDGWVGAVAEVEGAFFAFWKGGGGGGVAGFFLGVTLRDAAGQGAGIGCVGTGIVLDCAGALESGGSVDEGGAVDGEGAGGGG